MSVSMMAAPAESLRFPKAPISDVGVQRRALPISAPWDERALRRWIAANLGRNQVIVVSDRQPVAHERVAGVLQMSQPASGLVTAVEPVLRACAGTWIAHGSGGADREVVDASDGWDAPAERGAYRLRRVWLTPDEERGYRHGFANSGLWPLCHLVHVRPVFTDSDWQHYQTVNQRFADAVVSETRQDDPIVLIQDYHLALVPGLLRTRLPRATIVVFWHVPWTSSEQMGICPWLPAVMDGLLGSDIIGFQTDQHRRNFVETAERSGYAVEGTDRLQVVGDDGRRTQVRVYPISVSWPDRPNAPIAPPSPSAAVSTTLLRSLPSDAKLIVGIDRFDYTKGLVERLQAVEHLLDTHPWWLGRLRFVQVASPSRIALPEYRAFRERVFGEVRRINARFSGSGPEPISLLDAHHDHTEVDALYRAADLCLVTSLHDGMNLVSKEFVAARDDELGVLVLSQFAGAAEELGDALIVNPYHTAQVAEAIHRGLTMSLPEQRRRMQALRVTVKLRNVHCWAATLLRDAARLRTPALQVDAAVARA